MSARLTRGQLLALSVLVGGRARRSTETVTEVTYHRGEVVSVHRRVSWQAADALVLLGLAHDDHTGGDLAIAITAVGTGALADALRLDPQVAPVRMRRAGGPGCTTGPLAVLSDRQATP